MFIYLGYLFYREDIITMNSIPLQTILIERQTKASLFPL